MLAGVGTFVLFHQRRGLFGNRAHFLRAISAHVEDRPHMQAAHRGMRIPGALGAVLVEDLGQAVGVFGEVLQRHRTVFDEGHRFAVAFHRHHDVQSGLAHFPEFLLHDGIDDFDHTAGEAAFTHQFDQLFQAADLFVAVFAGKLHQQDRCGFALHALIDDGPERGIAARQFDHRVVDQLDRRGLQLDDVLRRLHRLVKRREMADAQSLVFRQRRQPQLDAAREGQRALGADQQMRHVHTGWQHHVEVVTADSAQYLRITVFDFLGFAARNAGDAFHEVAVRARAVEFGQVLRQRAEAILRTVRQPGIDAQHVVHHVAVFDGARAAGIVAGHAADGGLRAGRDIHREPQAVGFQPGIQVVEHHARLHGDCTCVLVEGGDLVQVF